MTSESRARQDILRMSMDEWVKTLILLLVVGSFVALLQPKLVVQEHDYKPGDIAEHDIKASRDFFVEDRAATEKSRTQAVDRVLTVYDLDPRIGKELNDKVRKAFQSMRTVIADLRTRQPADLVENQAIGQDPAQPAVPQRDEQSELLAQKPDFESQMGLELSRGAYDLLISQAFSAEIADLITRVLNDILANGVVANKEVLLKELDRGITLRNVVNQTEKTVLALRQYYGPDQAKTMVRIVAEPVVRDLDYNAVNLIVDLSQRLLQPNITLNRNETEERKRKALETIKPIMYQIKTGEMILREGERVTDLQILKLQAMTAQSDDPAIVTTSLGAGVFLAILLLALHTLYLQQQRHARLNQNRHLLFMGLMLIFVFLMAKVAGALSGGVFPASAFSVPDTAIVYAVPAAAGAMLVCLFLGFEIAIPFGVIAAICTALLLGNDFKIFLFALVNNTMAAYWVRQSRERKLFITAGIKLGLLNIVLASAASIYASEYAVEQLLWSWLLAFSGGMLSGIATLGLAPLVEMAFQYTTDITLLELANLDRPILRRLMLEAPGTYHHSVIVGSLVEAAAAEIDANPLLAKVCGYYHDIGKVKKPLYFIENQRDGRNKHDKLAPSMSSLILIAHVKDGVEIARKNKLGQAIIDTIQQHHGSSLISYFYEKAKQLKGEEAVKLDDYRYPGPKPQTKEAGLVMLADVVEAASRTLENPTPSRIQGLVQNLINKVFSDGQLDNCELTLKDLHRIAMRFIKILNGIHHHRIEYAETSAREDGKNKNGSPDRQSTGKSSHRDQSRSKEGTGHLKRLGQP